MNQAQRFKYRNSKPSFYFNKTVELRPIKGYKIYKNSKAFEIIQDFSEIHLRQTIQYIIYVGLSSYLVIDHPVWMI
jgi:hypothetical protein